MIVEAMLFRGLLDLGGSSGSARNRLGAIAAVAVFSLTLLLLEIPLAGGVLRLGRRLETRLRLAFLRKIPRLGDRYFQSRLKSDMAERSHSIHLIRRLPELGGQLSVIFSRLFLLLPESSGSIPPPRPSPFSPRLPHSSFLLHHNRFSRNATCACGHMRER